MEGISILISFSIALTIVLVVLMIAGLWAKEKLKDRTRNQEWDSALQALSKTFFLNGVIGVMFCILTGALILSGVL